MITRRQLLLSSVSTIALGAPYAFARRKGGVPVPPTTHTISDVSLGAPGNYAENDPDGTVVGALGVTADITFTGTLAITGTDSSKFKLSSSSLPSSLELNGTGVAGTQSINIVATDTAFSNSPYTKPFMITGTAAGAHQVDSRTLVNTSASALSAGFHSDIMGLWFKDGDMPAGQYPQFKLPAGQGATVQAISAGCYAYWKSGAMKFCAALFRSSVGISGSSSQVYEVWNGGAAPTASARTLTDVYNQSLQVNGVGLGSNFGLSGTWNALLANDANNHEQFAYLDGPAGKVWRILTDFVQSGAAHGQLVCYHYIAALSDSSGNLGGFRHLGRINQPYYNQDTPAKNWRAFSSVTWQYGAGPTTVALQWPLTARNFTHPGSPGATMTATSLPDWYCGTTIGGPQVVPGYLSTTGTLPAGLNTTQIYFANITKGVSTFFLAQASNQGAAGVSATDAGTGIHTFTPVPTCLHFGSIFTADAGAKWNFFQGTGSLTADGTTRVQFPAAYLKSAKLIPPFDLTIAVTRNFWGAAGSGTTDYDWNPISVGACYTPVGNPSDVPDLGVLNKYQAVDVYVQDAITEKVARMIGLAAAHMGALRDKTTRTVLNLSASSYTGLPASVATTVKWVDGGASGFTGPPARNTSMAFGETNASHRANLAGYAYLRFGEPQYLDLMTEQAIGLIGSFAFDHRNPTVPYSAKGVITAYSGKGAVRQIAWAARDLADCAALFPLAAPDGSDAGSYIRNLATASGKFPGDALANLLPAYCVDNGNWVAYLIAGQAGPEFNSSWQTSFMDAAMGKFAAMCESSEAAAWLQQRQKWLKYKLDTWGGYLLTPYYERTINGPLEYQNANSVPIASDAQYAAVVGPTIVFTINSLPGTGTRGFTITNLPSGAVLTNGDKFIFTGSSGNVHPGGFSVEVPYYVVNTSGSACDLAATVGGTAIQPTTAGTVSAGGFGPGICYYLPIAPPAASTGKVLSGGISTAAYVANVRGVCNYSKAIGTTSLETVISDCDTRIAAGGGIDFTTDPRWAWTASFT